MRPYYDAHGITIYHADWREAAAEIKDSSVGLLLTDPPYAATKLAWDKPIDWPEFWNHANRISKPSTPMVLFAAGHFTTVLINSNRKHFRYELIWEKTMATGFLDANRRPLRAHENILVFIRNMKMSLYNPQMTAGRVHSRGTKNGRALHYGTFRTSASVQSNKFYPRSVLHFSNARGARSLHPTQKPLDLMLWLIRTYSRPRNLIVDTFCGSGSTLVAALKAGRRAIGIEAEERYCEVAAQRLEEVSGHGNTTSHTQADG